MAEGSGMGRALQAGGSLLSGIAGFQSGKANARMAKMEADSALRGGVAEADDIRMRARRAAGEAVAAMGANGVSIGTGSALDVLREIEMDAGLDRLRVQTEARNRAGALRYQARLAKKQGAYELLGGVISAGSAAFGGGGG